MKKEERIARQRKQARAVQVREAQRRRRARLKSENQRFLQIIVPDDLRELIFAYGNTHGLTLQEAAVVLVQQGLGLKWEMPATSHPEDDLDALEPTENMPDFEDSFAGLDLEAGEERVAPIESEEDEVLIEEPEYVHPVPTLDEDDLETVAIAALAEVEVEVLPEMEEPDLVEPVLEEIQEDVREEEAPKPEEPPAVAERRRPRPDDGQMSLF